MKRAILLATAMMAAMSGVRCASFGTATENEHEHDDAAAPPASAEASTDADASTDAVAPDTGGDANPSCPPPAVSEGLVAHYPLNEASGTRVPDCASAPHDGSIPLPGGDWVAGRNGGGLRVSNSSTCVDLGASATLAFTTAFTVSVWVKIRAFVEAPGAGYIVGKTLDPDLAGWRLAVGADGIDAAVARTSGVRLTVSGPAPLGEWLHVALVVQPGGEMTLQLGNARYSVAGVPSPLVADTVSLAKMGCNSNDTQPLDGTLDDLHVYSRALSALEIDALAK